jgi:hypothetical protein
MFVPCIIRRSRNNQHDTQIYTTAVFYMLAPTCFGRSMPSSERFWICLSYVKIQIDMVVYHIVWLSDLSVGVSWFSLLCFPAKCIVHSRYALSWEAQQTETRHSNRQAT